MRASVRPQDPTAPATPDTPRRTDPQSEPPDPEDPPAKTPSAPSNGAKPLRPLGAVKALVERGPAGLLPKIGPDGKKPAQIYARKSALPKKSGAKRARIAIMLGGLGLSVSASNQAITRLPGEISLAFAPYAKGLGNWRRKARLNGHEVLLQIPMEPFDYPDNDPGPYTLLNRLTLTDNIRRLKWLMSRFTGYFAATNYMGARFTSSPDALRPVLEELNNRGIAYIDDGTSPRSRAGTLARQMGMAYARADIVIDTEHAPATIDANLRRLQTIALERGLAIGSGTGLPITIERLAEWIETLDNRKIILVPVSAALSKPVRQARKR